MGGNEIQNFVIRIVTMLGENCSCFVKKYPYHSCSTVFLCVLCLFSPLGFIILAYCFPIFGFSVLVYRIVIVMYRRKVRSTSPKRKTWKGFQSRRSFRSVYRVHLPKQRNESSFVQDPPSVRQNAAETSDMIFSNNMNANLIGKKASIEENPKGIRDCGFDEKNHEVKIQGSLDDVKDKEKQHHEKSLMDLGISEAERTKRLEILMERRRSRTLAKFQVIRTAMGVGVSSLNIPKKNPFLSKDSGVLNSPGPGSAPTVMIKNNPFDLPYDPHEEKPILTGDSFGDEFITTQNKDPSFFIRESSAESTIYKNKKPFDPDFAISQLRRLGASKLAHKENVNKQPQCIVLEEGESSEKAVNAVDPTKEHKADHDVIASDRSTSSSSSSSSSSEDEPILRPNKEAILHCLSMSRMRVLSQGNSFRRNSESFDCGPSALFDKSKPDYFIFGPNKRAYYGSTNSLASDMQVEVSEPGSPPSTNLSSLDEDSKGSFVNAINPLEMDSSEVRLGDIDEASEEGKSYPGFRNGPLIRTVSNRN